MRVLRWLALGIGLGLAVGLGAGLGSALRAQTGAGLRGGPVDFNLPAQPAAAALLAFSHQARIELLFSYAALRDVPANAVIGRYEPAAALDQLLAGTGFVARRNGRGKFAIARAAPPTGSLQGRLLTPAGLGARGLHVNVVGTRLVATTDGGGAFALPAVPPGVQQLAVNGSGYQTLLIEAVQVEAGRTLTLAPQTVRAAGDPHRLEPFVVEDRAAGAQGLTRDPSYPPPRTALGNIDLPRTADDALPYEIYDREQIARSGVANLNEFLQRELLESDASTQPPDQSAGADTLGLPGTSAINASSVAGSFLAGSTNLNLRGYGADETVVLVNGRRLPQNVVAGYYSQPPDVNLIPLDLVERVEVLPISASAIYSGNPVGGVINIVLRPEVNLTEVTATYTNALGRFDAPQSTASLLHGESLLGGRLQLRFTASVNQTTPPTEAELGYIRSNLLAHPSLNAAPLFRATPNVSSASLTPLFGPGTPDLTSVAPGADGSGGLGAFAGRAGVPSLGLFQAPGGGLANSPESADYPYGRRQRGSSYFGSITYAPWPRLQVGVDALYSHSVVNRGYDVFEGNLLLPAGAAANPFGQDVKVTLNETAPALGQNYDEARLDSVAAVGSVLLTLPAHWSVSLDAQYGEGVTRYRGLAGVDPARWQQLVNSGTYNPLRDPEVAGPPAAFYEQALIFYGGPGRFVTLGNYQELDAAARVANRAVAWPTGPGQADFGLDYQRDALANYHDVRTYGDGSPAVPSAEWIGRTISQYSGFGEVQAPLLPARWLPRWLTHVNADVAARYVAAKAAQDASVAPTAGLKFDFAGGLSLRGTYASANRFPSPQLSTYTTTAASPASGGGAVSLTPIIDPLRGGTTYGVESSDEINPRLRPEAAATRTVGAIFQRGQVRRLRLSVDFVDTRTSGEIIYLQPQTVVNLESELPGRVTRAPLAPGDPSGAGVITSVLTGVFNLAWRHSQNWNTSIDYAWADCLGGRLDLYARWVYFQSYQVEPVPGAATVDEINHPDSEGLALMKQRVNFGAGWSKAAWGLGLDGHYYGARKLPVDEWADQGSDHIDPFWQFDGYLQSDLARWLPWKSSRFGLRVQWRVNNLFDAKPPSYFDDPSGAGVQQYGDWRGRTYSLSMTATF
jgi:outer membrane receptor protein involved in Fe transport